MWLSSKFPPDDDRPLCDAAGKDAEEAGLNAQGQSARYPIVRKGGKGKHTRRHGYRCSVAVQIAAVK